MKLIFVYNADSGFVNTLMDIGHKIINPETYTCNLCKLTFDTFKESSQWKEFRLSREGEMEFLHRDEFEKRYHRKTDYPVIMREEKGELVTLVSSRELNEFKSIDELMEAVKNL